MKTELEKTDIQAIAQEVIKAIKPLLSKEEAVYDCIFTVKTLAEYLKVKEDWIYQNQRAIPHFKIGRLTRYRKREIDKWLELQKIPASEDLSRPLRIIK